MKATVKPTNSLQGSVELPASKSYSIRSFIVALCGGTSTILRASDCDDAKVALHVAKCFGAKVTRLDRDSYKIQSWKQRPRFSEINVKESGTVLRFLLPLLSLYTDKGVIVGEGTLRGRPNHHLVRALQRLGKEIKGRGPQETVPIRISGGILKGGRMEIDGSLSSQFISALLITCPQMMEDSRIHIKGKKIVSSDYIQMTQQILAKAGITVKKRSPRLYCIKGAQQFEGLKNFTVPSDYGLAAFPLAAGVLTSSDVTFKGCFNDAFVQADGHILDFLKRMGVRFKKTSRSIRIRGPQALRGGVFSLKDCPDLVPIMAVLALFAKTATRLCHIKHARVKESNRISDLRQELLKIGACVKEKEDELIIHPQQDYKPNVVLDPHKDHRLAMAFSVLGIKIGVRIKDMECVSKSYPGFVKDFKSMGAKITR